MLKNKRILLTILAILLLILIPNMVNATNESPVAKSEIASANKSVKVTLTDISLDDAKEYKFGVSKAKASEPTEWLELQDISSEQCVAIITPQNNDMRLILRSNNKCYLFIKNVTDDEITITTQVELPELLDIKINTNNDFEINYLYEKCNTFYENLGNYQITAVKIDNKDIIKKYLSAKENNQNTLNAIKDMLPTEKPTDTWSKMNSGNDFTSTSAKYSAKDLIKYEGLYMIWGQVSYIEGRTIYGYMLYDNYPNGYKLPEEDGDDKSSTPTDKPGQTPVTDTKQYVSFPFIITNGKSSVSLKKGMYDGKYTMYYQFVEVSDEVYNKLNDLKTKYENKEITYEEYFVQYNQTVTKYNDSNWIKTEDGSFKQDLSKFTGTKKFALWVKLVMEDKTVYEAQIYTMNGSGTATNEPHATDKSETPKKDTTTATTKLPNTGKIILIWSIAIIAVSGIVAHIRYKKLYM